jgi:thiol-disulfide isomerase/thioredoxin
LVITPDFALAAPDGRTVTLSDEVQKQTTVLLFWATWCPYCKALMPHLQSIRLEYGAQVEILAINIKEDGDPVAFMDNVGYDFTLLLDGDAVGDRYGVTGTPVVIVVDEQRRLRFDLRRLPRLQLPNSDRPASDSSKAAYLAPYWAAEIRQSLDDVLRDR